MSTQKEEILSEPNTEPINFRVPKTMKASLKLLCKYGQYSSAGELLRTLVRKHTDETVNSQGYKFWLKREEVDQKAKEEKAKQEKLYS